MNKRKAFVVMPFSEQLVDLWKKGIYRACQDCGWECVRADMISSPGFIVGQLYQSIAAADLIIGEMTDRNPNVFYEIGYANALGKPTVLLATTGDDLKAFDTQGLRHFLHGGQPDKVRTTLMQVLPEMEAQLALEPRVPDSRILYEWPGTEHPAPVFTWKSSKPGWESQIDLCGGQRIIETPGLGSLISVTDTTSFWNPRPGVSIMELVFTKELSRGDFIHLFLDGRSSDEGKFDLVGDGGWVEDNGGKKWAEAWPEESRVIRSSQSWKRWQFSIRVAPTSPSYDLARGVVIYLLTHMERGSVFFKRMHLVHRPIQSSR
jgi:hypothetical protein